MPLLFGVPPCPPDGLKASLFGAIWVKLPPTNTVLPSLARALTLNPSSRLAPWLTFVTQAGSAGRVMSALATWGASTASPVAPSVPASTVP